MAYCAYCGTELSEQAVACPNCGHPNEARGAPMQAPAGIVAAGDYAGFWRRLAARLLDGLLLSVLTFPRLRSPEAGMVSVWFDFTPTLLGFVYHWLMIGLNKGQTLGKMALRVRITRPDGSPVGLGSAAAREAMAFVSALALGLGFLWAAWDREHRTWHDMVADTRAYRVPR